METYPIIIGGVKKETEEVTEVRFPYTGEVYARVYLAGAPDLEDAMAAAVTGFEKMRRLSSYERSKILDRLATGIRQRADELIQAMVMEGGKTTKFASAEAGRAEITVRTSAEEARRIYGEILPLDWSDDTKHRTGYLMRVPVGPVLGIVPFNFPLNLACHKLAPAIAAGNSIILKPASATPISSLLLGEMALAAGAPAEAINVVPCPGERAEIMVRDPRVAFI